jgi:hypothetical protein
MPKPSDPALTPQEQEVYDFHKRNLDSGLYQTNDDGSITTFKGAVVGTPNGQMLMPTYWHGQERAIPDAYRMAIRSGIPFPVYKTADEALAREQVIHQLMSRDIDEFQKRKKTR